LLYIIAGSERQGAKRQLALLAAGLPREEFEVHVCVLGQSRIPHNSWLPDSVPVETIERRWRWDPLTWLALQRLMGRLRPNVVQTWLFDANAYGRAAAARDDVPAIVAVERYLDADKNSSQWWLDRRLARHTHCLVANSSAVAEFYQRHGVAARSFEVIPDGVERPAASMTTRAALLASLGLPPKARLIAAACRLASDNRVKDLIWSIDILKIIHDQAHLLVLGDGPQRHRLEYYQRKIGVDKHVHFLGDRHDARQLLGLADLFWHAGDRQGMPSALLEAMAAGVPVMASDTASHRAIVSHGNTGFLIRLGDRAALAKYAHRLLEDGALAQRIGAAARERVLGQFSVPKMVERYANLYRRLLP
jgi:glycosyltransferase involved in cell wall biosynthesis